MIDAARWTRRLALGVPIGVALGAAALALALATSGVFDRRPGAWTVPLRPLPGVSIEANVAGVLRLATSPLGLRVLDGQRRPTRIGLLAFTREHDTLVVRCAPCRVNHPRLASRTVALPAVELRAARRTGIESNRLVDLRVVTGALQMTAVATLAPTGITLAWSLPSAALADAYRVLADAVPEARLARIEGRVQASGQLALPALRATSSVRIDGFEVGGLGTERLQHGWFAFGCRAADGTPRTVTSGEGETGWLDAAALGPLLPAAVRAAEDQRFFQHAGYDPVEIGHALAEVDFDFGDANADATDAGPPTAVRAPAAAASTPALAEHAPAPPLRGASTITQQLARTLHTGGERSIARKLRELLYAVEMERTLGKDRILLLYLNTVDWGPGLCGARAAARTYFRKPPARLTPLEAAWLAGILRAPHTAHARQFRGGQPDGERARRVLMQMRELPKHERARWAQRPLALATPGSEHPAAALRGAHPTQPRREGDAPIVGRPAAGP